MPFSQDLFSTELTPVEEALGFVVAQLPQEPDPFSAPISIVAYRVDNSRLLIKMVDPIFPPAGYQHFIFGRYSFQDQAISPQWINVWDGFEHDAQTAISKATTQLDGDIIAAQPPATSNN